MTYHPLYSMKNLWQINKSCQKMGLNCFIMWGDWLSCDPSCDLHMGHMIANQFILYKTQGYWRFVFIQKGSTCIHGIGMLNLCLYYDMENNFPDLYLNGMLGHKDNERMMIPCLSCQMVVWLLWLCSTVNDKLATDTTTQLLQDFSSWCMTGISAK